MPGRNSSSAFGVFAATRGRPVRRKFLPSPTVAMSPAVSPSAVAVGRSRSVDSSRSWLASFRGSKSARNSGMPRMRARSGFRMNSFSAFSGRSAMFSSNDIAALPVNALAALGPGGSPTNGSGIAGADWRLMKRCTFCWISFADMPSGNSSSLPSGSSTIWTITAPP